MFLQPKKTKHRKIKKQKLKRLNFFRHKLAFGVAGLKALNSGFISARQLEAARRAITRKLQRKGKLWLRVFPDYPVTKRPGESRMGKGTGSLSFWASPVSAGSLVFEICGVPYKDAKDALTAGGWKLPVKTKVVK